MICAIIPVKPLDLAKGRLAGVLTAGERRALALAMLEDVLVVLAAARGVDRIGVISPDPTALALAATLGADALIDTSADLNAALAQATGHYTARGATAALILHADVPLVTPYEIERLLALREGARGVALAPARDGGTNALLAWSPLAIPFMFGAGSLQRHLEAAAARGVPAQQFHTRGLALDIDRPDDLLLLAESEGETAAQRLVRELSACERVMCI